MDTLEEAILCSYNTSLPEEVRNRATEYTNQIRTSPDGWILCVEKLTKTTRVEVKFFCLIVLREAISYRFELFTPTQNLAIKTFLVDWLTKYLPQAQEDVAIKNKFAQVMTLYFKQVFPTQWPTFFTELFSYLQLGPVLIDMFLRIMKSIDEEVISNDVPRNTAELAQSTEIKDRMRDLCVTDLAKTWFSILSNYPNYSSIELARDCLDNIKRYTKWIDINLIANDNFVNLLFKFLLSEQLREGACDVIYELIDKGMMDPFAKLALFSKLNLINVFSTVSQDDDSDFLISVAKIINTLGVELSECIGKIQTLVIENRASPEMLGTAQRMLEEALMLSLRFMNNEDDDVSMETFQSSLVYLNAMKNNTELSAKQLEQLKLYLQIIRNKMKYEPTFNFVRNDEDEVHFLDYRKDLRNIYKAIAKISPQLVASFVEESITAVSAALRNNINSLQFFDVEVALTLFHSMGDGIQESTLKSLEAFFSKIITIIATSNISHYPHQSVILTYFETVVRYAKYIVVSDGVSLKNIIISFIDERGIRSNHVQVRSRVCYLLLRFVKTQATALRPYFVDIFQNLKPFMVISFEVQKSISFDDQINLYDTVGTLVGVLSENQGNFTGEIVNPLISQMEEILSKQLYKTDTQEKPIFTTFLIQIMTVAGTFSKGFNANNKESLQTFTRVMEILVEILKVLPNQEEIRAKVILYTHRMTDCLGTGVLQYLGPIITQLMVNCSIKDLIEFTRLLNQLMAKFKEYMFPIIDSILLKLIERIFSIGSQLASTSSSTSLTTVSYTAPKTEAERELLDVQKAYYLLLSNIVSNNLANVLRSQTNIGNLNQIIRTVLQGCCEYRDMNVSKQCYVIIKRLVEVWCGGDSTSIPGFNKFVFEDVIAFLIKELVTQRYQQADTAGVNLVFHEMIAIQKTLLVKCGPEFIEYLSTVLLPSLNCPAELIQRYIHSLQTDSLKNFKTFFTSFILSFKT